MKLVDCQNADTSYDANRNQIAQRNYLQGSAENNKLIDWTHYDTWNATYDIKSRQASERHYLETSTKNNKLIDWQHRYTWVK
ncbi:hypothetical protein [Candidatus Phytoplasma tritici]|uniref:hypothetical protein n=1 Tax=Candidatus Phytoplasma tritici TaxID=321961 RepID=UPI00040CC08C|nr:hypothetical protein [Candidatus Phytoplasma tritici]